MKIGILTLQGDFEAHQKILEECGAQVAAVRQARDLQGCAGLVIPGGESTVMSRLCDRFALWQPISERLQNGMGAFGTCAGMILLARGLEGASANFQQKTLGALDIDVARNAYGAQLDSFEANIEMPSIGVPLRGVFIRAPQITRCGPQVETLAEHQGQAVVVRHGKIMASSFHPEIAGEARLHRLWLESLQNPLQDAGAEL